MLPAQPAPGLRGGALRPAASGERFGVVAGGGLLPKLVAEAAAANGWHPLVVTIADAKAEDWTGFDAEYFGCYVVLVDLYRRIEKVEILFSTSSIDGKLVLTIVVPRSSAKRSL